jgi:protein-S-isoprenylcysteine O-methyltransferase Ste14
MAEAPPLSLLHHYLFQVAWCGWAAYWYLTSFTASAPKRTQSASARMLHRAELVLAFALFTFPALGYGWLGHQLVPWSEDLFFSGASLLLLGIGFAIWARMHLGQYWSGYVTLKPGHRLIRSGPYALVRHPIYTGILLAMIGTAIVIDRVRGVLAVIIAAETFVRKLRIEERWLTEEFGDEYERYRKEVKALVPGIV